MGVFRQFPYSNFHEMNMDEIIKIIKNMLEEWARYHAEWDQWMADLEASWTEYQDDVNAQWAAYQNTMNTAWQSMQNFINNYFDNLDVQEEINNKIVSMIQTGEFGQLVNEYIPPAVSAWLALHITQPTGVVIDTSLSVSGACADAKTTGDFIRTINENIFEHIEPTFSVIDDSYIGVNGVLSSASLFHRSDMIDLENCKYIISEFTYTGADCSAITFYRDNNDYTSVSRVSMVQTVNEGDIIEIPDEAKYVVISALKTTELSIYGWVSIIDEVVQDTASNTDHINVLENRFTTNGILTRSSAIWTVSHNHYASSAGLVENAGYDSYYFTTDKTTELYSDGAEENSYYSITLFANGTIDSENYIARYRKSEENLPTQANPITVSENTVIVITILSTDIDFSLITDLPYNVIMAPNVGLGAKQIAEVQKISSNVPCKILYESGSFAQGASEKINVFIPSNAGFIKYVMLHCVDATSNCDNWHIYRAIKTDADLNEVNDLTTDGEWECAVFLNGRSDYSGGYAHGDEVYNNITVICDGEIKTFSELTTISNYDAVEILETTTLYDPADNTTPIAEHGKRYVFTPNGMEIHQTLKWLYTGAILDCYLAMFPAAKTVTDAFYLDNNYKPTAIPVSPNLIYNDIEYSVIYSTSAKFRAEISVPEYPNEYIGSGVFSLRDNNSNYNKIYYQISTTGDTVTSGDIWKSKTIYKLELIN